jgi:hypothetical protein
MPSMSIYRLLWAIRAALMIFDPGLVRPFPLPIKADEADEAGARHDNDDPM